MSDTRDPDPFMLYTVVRRSLGMTAGKIAGQSQHAFDYLTREVDRLRAHIHPTEEEQHHLADFVTWRNSKAHAKIVLGASDEQYRRVKDAHPDHFVVIDLGFTQVAPNTETCLVLWPMRKSARSQLLQDLKPL